MIPFTHGAVVTSVGTHKLSAKTALLFFVVLVGEEMVLGLLGLPEVISTTAPQFLSALSPYVGASLLVGAGSYAYHEWVRRLLLGERLHRAIGLFKDIHGRMALTKSMYISHEESARVSEIPYMWEQLKAHMNSIRVPVPSYGDDYTHTSRYTPWLIKLIGCAETKDIKRARRLLEDNTQQDH